MSQAAPTIKLTALDAPRPFAPNPAILERNLAALAATNPDFADQLRDLKLPDHWQPVRALDDTPTYRCEPPGRAPAWLGNTAVPTRRAAATLDDALKSEKNVALPCLGAGAELLHLLAHLPPHVAVFVFEEDPHVVAAVLRLRDLADYLARGRCLILPADREAAALQHLLETHVGLLTPTNILLKDLVAQQRCETIRQTCEQVGSRIVTARNDRLQELLTQPAGAASAPPSTDRVSLAILSLRPDPEMHAHARQLAEAAAELGWPITCRTVTTPYDVDGLAHCQALHAAQPQLTISIDHYANVLPLQLTGTKCTWIVREPEAPLQPPTTDLALLAASPRVASALREKYTGPAPIIDWYWGCHPTTSDPIPQTPAEKLELLFIADLPDDDPARYGVKHSSHQALWQRLRRQLRSSQTTRAARNPHDLLARAERETGLHIGDADLRSDFLRVTEHVVVPLSVLEHIAELLSRERVHVQTVGHGWQRLDYNNFSQRAETYAELIDSAPQPAPHACIYAPTGDPLRPLVLYAAAHGWPLIICEPGTGNISATLNTVLQPDQHYHIVRDTLELPRALQSFVESPQTFTRRAARAACHVRENHAYTQRLITLAQQVLGPTA